MNKIEFSFFEMQSYNFSKNNKNYYRKSKKYSYAHSHCWGQNRLLTKYANLYAVVCDIHPYTTLFTSNYYL